jgi:alpha-amylase/alpha-mannosidase (GH57 family)
MKYVCIHGHFYQPPRENPWLEAIERQDASYPDHDWNERILHECYAVNAAARMLDEAGRIARLVNNYERISFNIGPTLLSWLAEKSPPTYAAILAADKASAERFSGHGSALAQPFNHPILPLCNDRDRRTQVLWGIRDFESRFGRRPEGMWLPETAVNTASLEQLADAGIRFTILAPRQADKIRPIAGGEWRKIDGGIDPGQAYLCQLPSGKSITLFFYDGATSQALAFEGLLHSADNLVDRLLQPLHKDTNGTPRLSHIATDGESYGHHHRYGEMALAAALDRIDRRDDVSLTNYGEFLDKHPPKIEVKIEENTSWSCAHGIGRWFRDCGCNCGRIDGGHQRWRGPLREAFDWLRDTVAGPFEKAAGKFLRDPWLARERYIDVILDRSPERISAFFEACATRPLNPAERSRVLELMELQRHAMLMYTSCGWFFDDIGGIETIQVIRYAGRVVQLARTALGLELEGEFISRLERAEGNLPEYPNGRAVYEHTVKPAMVDALRVGAHYAITSLFDAMVDPNRVYCFAVDQEDERRRSSGRMKLNIGHIKLTSRITLRPSNVTYVLLHLGEHHVTCAVREFSGEDSYRTTAKKIEAAFDRGDFPEVVRRFDDAFGDTNYSITSLFRDEQHTVLQKLLEAPLAQIDSAYRQIYEQHAPLARFLKQLDLPVPRRIQMVGGVFLSEAVRAVLRQARPDLKRLAELRDEAQRQGIPLDAATVGTAARAALTRLAAEIAGDEKFADPLAVLAGLVTFMRSLEFQVDLWPAQEVFIRHVLPRYAKLKTASAERSRPWQPVVAELGDALRVRI